MPAESVKVEPPQPAVRGRSTIDYPYLDLDNAIQIAQKVRDVGTDGCEWNQLATSLNVAPDGGGFRLRMLSAKTFGLLTYERGEVRLTELGIYAVEPSKEKRARYDSFMAVGLFRQLFERLNGRTLPPAAAIERLIVELGAAPKQKEKVRQNFLRSAKQAGLFELSSDRLTTPPNIGSQVRERQDTTDERISTRGSGGGGGDSGGPLNIHPAILGLLRELPAPGTELSTKKRDALVSAFTAIVGYVYPEPETF